jgi:hypothetical protein
MVGAEDPSQAANGYAAEIRGRLNDTLAAERLPWAAYGTFGGFHISQSKAAPDLGAALRSLLGRISGDYGEVGAARPEFAPRPAPPGHRRQWPLNGFVSATRGPAELEPTVTTFRKALTMLRSEGELPTA